METMWMFTYEWIKKMQCMCTVKCYSALNKGILPFPTMWMGLGNIMLPKSSQTQRWILHVESKNHQIINLETVERYLQELEEMRRSYSKGSKFESESEVAQSYPTLCDPMDCSLPGSSSMGFSRQEYWSGLPFPSSGDLPNPGIKPGSPALEADALTSEPPGKSLSYSYFIEANLCYRVTCWGYLNACICWWTSFPWT